ncbi:MAG: RagB/SusD family nutrient uptake outer membrane protein [Bacteroidales bacterium]|nr:RagB/SusD family nutrient uptake outer membrane protein [Bacteroidales bacterium]
MKIIKYILILAAGVMSSCELQQMPFDAIGQDEIYSSEVNVEAITKGQYANCKDQVPIRGQIQWWSITQRAMEIFTLQGDDAIYAQTGGASDMYGGDIFNHPLNGQFNQVWYAVSFRNIGVCNTVIANVQPETQRLKELIAENYFLRGMWYLNAMRLWAKPYTLGTDNPGLPLRLEPSTENLPREKVGVVYDQILSDFKTSITDLPPINQVLDHGRASREAAWAYLSRTYVWMTDPDMDSPSDKAFADSAIAYATKVLASPNVALENTAGYFGSTQLRNPITTLPGTPFQHYYAKAKASKETILCIARADIEAKLKQDRGALWIDDGKANGWGQIYATKSYRQMLGEYPNDLRHNFIEPVYQRDANGNVLYNPGGIPVISLYRSNQFTEMYYVNKFSYQSNGLTLNSEVFMRVAEVILNRAEAYAKLADMGLPSADGKNPAAECINDINIIRQRAGLSGTDLYSVGDLKGLASYLDVVLKERKLELAFDFNRSVDLFRNKRSLTETTLNGVTFTIPYTDPRVAYRIPQIEMDLNPLLVQN